MKKHNQQSAIYPVYPVLGVFTDSASPIAIMKSGLGDKVARVFFSYPEPINKTAEVYEKRLQLAELKVSTMQEF